MELFALDPTFRFAYSFPRWQHTDFYTLMFSLSATSENTDTGGHMLLPQSPHLRASFRVFLRTKCSFSPIVSIGCHTRWLCLDSMFVLQDGESRAESVKGVIARQSLTEQIA